MIYLIEDFKSIPTDDAYSSFKLSHSEEGRIKNKKNREQSIYARYAAAIGIQKEFSLNTEDIVFSLDEKGKPIVLNESLHFSLAHTKNTVAAGISSYPIGIDIEYIRPFKEKIANRYFSPSERDYVGNSTNKDIAFTEIWCLKESIAKLTGYGLSKVISNTNIFVIGSEFTSENYHCQLKTFLHGNLIIGCAMNTPIPKDYIYFI